LPVLSYLDLQCSIVTIEEVRSLDLTTNQKQCYKLCGEDKFIIVPLVVETALTQEQLKSELQVESEYNELNETFDRGQENERDLLSDF